MNFAEFWSEYPAQSRHKGSKQKAARLFEALNIYERHEVERSLAIYAEHLGENGWKNPMHAATYLGRDRHWESFQPTAVVKAQIEKIDKRREHRRRVTQWQNEQAKIQWEDTFEKRYGYRPTRS